MSDEPEVLYFVIDSIDMDEGNAFLDLDAYRKQVDDPRLSGRFGRQDGKVYLETYNHYDMKDPNPAYGEFESVFVLAPNRRSAVVQLVRKLGYQKTRVEIKTEKE